jgi:hypothetical protein
MPPRIRRLRTLRWRGSVPPPRRGDLWRFIARLRSGTASNAQTAPLGALFRPGDGEVGDSRVEVYTMLTRRSDTDHAHRVLRRSLPTPTPPRPLRKNKDWEVFDRRGPPHNIPSLQPACAGRDGQKPIQAVRPGGFIRSSGFPIRDAVPAPIRTSPISSEGNCNDLVAGKGMLTREASVAQMPIRGWMSAWPIRSWTRPVFALAIIRVRGAVRRG